MADRLLELARLGAVVNHEWFFDQTMNMDDEPTEGHANDGTRGFGFSTCPHPDCILVRDGSAPLQGWQPSPEAFSTVRTALDELTKMAQSVWQQVDEGSDIEQSVEHLMDLAGIARGMLDIATGNIVPLPAPPSASHPKE